MYLPKYHQLTDQDAIQALIKAHPLGAWVYPSADGLVANHIPFYLDRHAGPFGTLIGHVSRANTVWQQLRDNCPSVILFQGPQAYITPNWYPGKVAHGKVVPTWNYTVAHAHGTARAIEVPQWLLGMLEQLTQSQEKEQEGAQARPWRVADAPADYIDRLMRGIVGIEIPITRLEGKRKASQDEDMADRVGTVQGLQASASDNAQAMAKIVADAIGENTRNN